MGYTIDTIVFIFGGVIGSFLNVCIFRLPRNKSIISPASFCPGCEKPIRFFYNIPFISYFLLGGKCKGCGNRIPLRYPIVEFITAFIFLLLYKKYGLKIEFLINIIFVSVLIVISFVDMDFKIIPDVLSIGGLCTGFILAFFRKPYFFYIDAIYGIIVGGGILFVIAFLYQFITKREGMGGGDIKLLGMIGAFCGLKGVIFSLIAGSFIGVLVGIPLMLIKGNDTKYAIPFGPFLSLAALLFLLKGDRFVYGFINFISGR